MTGVRSSYVQLVRDTLVDQLVADQRLDPEVADILRDANYAFELAKGDIERLSQLKRDQDSIIDGLDDRIEALEDDDSDAASLWSDSVNTTDSVTIQAGTSTGAVALNDGTGITLSSAGTYLVDWCVNYYVSQLSNQIVTMVAEFGGQSQAPGTNAADLQLYMDLSNTTPTRYGYRIISASEIYTTATDGDTVYINYGIGIGGGTASPTASDVRVKMSAVKIA